MRRTLLTWGAVGFATLLLTVWGVLWRAERAPQRYFELAEQKWRADDFLGAVRDYEKITEEYPRSKTVPEAYFWSGVIYFLYLGETQKAIDAFQKVIQRALSPSEQVLSARRYLAEIYEKKLNRPKDAIAEYEKVIAESPESEQAIESQYKVAEIYFALGELEEARAAWDRLIRKNPKSKWAPASLYRKGSTYFSSGNCREAVEVYRQVLGDYPESEMAQYAKFRTANCLEEAHRPEEALELYKELDGQYPNQELLTQKIRQLEKTQGEKEKLLDPEPQAPQKQTS